MIRERRALHEAEQQQQQRANNSEEEEEEEADRREGRPPSSRQSHERQRKGFFGCRHPKHMVVRFVLRDRAVDTQPCSTSER